MHPTRLREGDIAVTYLPYPAATYHGENGEPSGRTDGRPGDFLYVPQGGVHAFRNESGEPASMLILFTPRGAARGLLRAGVDGGGDVGGGARRVLPPARHVLDLNRPARAGYRTGVGRTLRR